MRYIEQINQNPICIFYIIMKKLIFSVVAALGCLSSFAQNQGEDNGFGLKFDFGFRGDKYGAYEGVGMSANGQSIDIVDGTKKVFPIKEFEKGDKCSVSKIPMFGLTMDNRWYVANPGNFGIGISARWLDVSVGALKYEVNGEVVSRDLDVKVDFLGPGLMGTYYLGNDKAIDVYYQVAPSINVVGSTDYKDGKQDDDSWSGNGEFGLSHYFGGAFRYKKFQFGCEYNIANMAGISLFSDDDNSSAGFEIDATRRNSLRAFVGFKF